MILSIDGLAKRYKMLPHEVLSQASTFDLYVMNTAISWQNQQQQIAINGGEKPLPKLSQDEMRAMMDNVRK